MSETQRFLQSVIDLEVSNAERLVALLWFCSLGDQMRAMTPSELCHEIEESGFGKQNTSRSRTQLSKDRRTVKSGSDSFRISAKARGSLTSTYSCLVDVIPAPRTDSVLAEDLFSHAHGYTRKVVRQVNASYHYGLFDCTAVMCRRLLETLIIETYEVASQEAQVKGPDGNYLAFSGLLGRVGSDRVVTLSRNGLKGLKDFKSLGDLSAHNRRFNARKNDIDRVRDGLRVACEELLHLAGQAT
jgi:hypothetical protein